MKKGEMAKEAERLLSSTGWLPEPLRLNEQPIDHTIDDSDPTSDTSIPDWLDDADGDTDDLDEETD